MAALRDLRLSALIAIVVAGGAAGALALSGRAPDIAPDALKAAVESHLGLPLYQLSSAPGGDAPWGPGDPVQLWFTAGDPPDLFRLSARRVGEATSVHGAPKHLRETPLAAEEILLARADQALVALRDGETIRVVALHGAVPMALYLSAPTKSMRGEWTPTGFSLTTDAGVVAVDVAKGSVAPANAGAWRTYAVQAPGPRVAGVNEAPPALPDRWRTRDPATPADVKLTVFDSREVALRYVPGVVRPGGVHGRPGPGVGPTGDPESPRSHAWLTVFGAGGAAVDGALLAPMMREGMAIAVDATQHARVGLFAGEPVPPRDGVLRQTGTPLVLDGRPVRVSPDVLIQRGFGITEDGMIIIADAPPTPWVELGEALARAGVVQAVALAPSDGARPHPDAEAFVVMDRQGLGAPRWRAAGWKPTGRYRATGRSGDVHLILIAHDANRVSIVPGAAEIGGADRRTGGRTCLTGGVRSERAPYGLSIRGQVRRTPREGELSLLIDEQGHARMGTASANIETKTSVLQGPQLIRDGRPAIEDRRVEPGVLTGIGARADGHLVYAHTREDVAALVDALLGAGVIDAIRLGDKSAPDAGRVVPPLELADAQGTALCLRPTAPPPAVLPAKAIRAW